MLAKCATKTCNQKFKYFGVGLLFIEAPKQGQRSQNSDDVEFYWLCERCARREANGLLKKIPVVERPPYRRAA